MENPVATALPHNRLFELSYDEEGNFCVRDPETRIRAYGDTAQEAIADMVGFLLLHVETEKELS